jgi:hypothetical protein
MPRYRLALVLASVSGGLCLAAGISYLTVPPTLLTIPLLGIVGCSLLVGVGVGQYRASPDRRRPRLAALGVLAALFTAGSALGFFGVRAAQSDRLEPTQLPAALHVAGFVVGAMLCLAVVLEFVSGILRGDRQRMPGVGGHTT